MVELDYRPSTSLVLTNGNLKGDESPEKLLESLNLDGDYHSKDPRVYKELWHFAKRSNSKLRALQFEIQAKEKELEIQKLSRPQKKEEAVKEEVTSEVFKPLTEEEEGEVAYALSNSNRYGLFPGEEKPHTKKATFMLLSIPQKFMLFLTIQKLHII
ncbi:OLC1v1016675C1 [Oldenlandia corymbosa var. corymbosa]|uniref:OLC1v1016675C1 n=1 Tax=Oldenlandia corymbosa var. corymbosa TaxID=529605 RepID=A0AAV1E7P4_OLDCO|nr:OLC1v1016675C1 [Oldenlandia corymbosa var. corymbosa]